MVVHAHGGHPEASWDALPLFLEPGTHPSSTDTTKVFKEDKIYLILSYQGGPAAADGTLCAVGFAFLGRRDDA
jgi:hypothetical protein